MEEAKIYGTCQCKGIKVESTSNAACWSQCFCSMCRKITGCPSTVFVAVPINSLKTTGETLRSFDSSNLVTWSFCCVCGCGILFDDHREPDTIWILASILDKYPPIGTTPKFQVYVDNKISFFEEMYHAETLKSTEMDQFPVNPAKAD